MSRENPGLSVDVEELDSGAEEDVTRKALMKLSLKKTIEVLIIHEGVV